MNADTFDTLLGSVSNEEMMFVQLQGDVAHEVDRLLALKNWTRRQLAEKAGVAESFISRVLSGDGNPTLRTLAKLSSALGHAILASPSLHHHVRYEVTLKIDSETFDDVPIRRGEYHEQKGVTIANGSYSLPRSLKELSL